MARRLTQETISQIRNLRSQGWSLPELKRKFQVGHGTVYRYIQDTKILPKYKQIWLSKRKSSTHRMLDEKQKAKINAKKYVFAINSKEKLLILSSLYWAEGHKKDFSFTNSDPQMIKLFIKYLRDTLETPKERIKLSIRIYEDMNVEVCKKFWLNNSGLDRSNLGTVNVLFGKKKGKLKHGMCRVRVRKGGSMLKYLTAIKDRVIAIESL